MRRLEEETGLSRGAIFHHFRDKESLFLAVAEDDAAAMVETVARHGLVQVMRDLLDRAGGAAGGAGEGGAGAPGESEVAGWLGTQLEVSRRLRTDAEFAKRWAARADAIAAATRERLSRQREAGVLRADVPVDVLAAVPGARLRRSGAAPGHRAPERRPRPRPRPRRGGRTSLSKTPWRPLRQVSTLKCVAGLPDPAGEEAMAMLDTRRPGRHVGHRRPRLSRRLRGRRGLLSRCRAGDPATGHPACDAGPSGRQPAPAEIAYLNGRPVARRSTRRWPGCGPLARSRSGPQGR